MGNSKYAGGNPVTDKHPIQEGVAILLAASDAIETEVKQEPHGPLGPV